MRTIYLAGAINGCTDAEAYNWRDKVRSHFYLLGIAKLKDPMVRDYRGREDACCAEIVELDKRDIRESDILLVRWTKPSVGTSMEVLYAFERDIPIILWVDPGATISPWLRYHASLIVSDFKLAMEKLENYL